MKFDYEYRTSDNVRHCGSIFAPDRERAFASLRATGIRPSRLEAAPGFFNRLWGRGKRWLAIAALAIIAAVAAILAATPDRKPAPADFEVRAQLYGDPAVIAEAAADGWRYTFADIGDAWLARHAVPARACDCRARREAELGEIAAALAVGLNRRAVVAPEDFAEVAQMKRMVNGMKDELAEYLRDGGSVKEYMEAADVRLAAEGRVYRRACEEFADPTDYDAWRRRNAELRAMGLPAIAAFEAPR